MEIIDIVNKIAKITFTNVYTYEVLIKLIKYKDNNYRKMICITLISLIETIIGLFLAKYVTLLIAMLIVYFIHSLVIAKITGRKFQYSIIGTFMSLTITYLIYIISILVTSFILKMTFPNIQSNNMLILIVTIIIANAILYKIFKIKRFSNGIVFLQDEKKINNIGVIGLVLIGITIIIYAILGDYRGYMFTTYLLTGIIVEIIAMTIWVTRKITKYYKQHIIKKTIEDLENELKQKNIEITRILKENQDIAKINHKYSSRIKAMEELSVKVLSKPEIVDKMKVEFGTEFIDIQNQIKKISEEYSSEMNEKIKHKNKIVKTGILGIDSILEHMKTEAEKSNIKFNLKVNANINYMVENVIEQSKLETLLGDHIKDAIIAINSSNNTYRSILTTISIIDDCYEICIYDTGIEFEIDTLLKLGTKPITTHKETGGSGIGFMTTFETIKETKASLIIEEKHEMNNTDYTKAIKIRFNGKNEYKILSYRAEKIEKQKTDGRVIIEK